MCTCILNKIITSSSINSWFPLNDFLSHTNTLTHTRVRSNVAKLFIYNTDVIRTSMLPLSWCMLYGLVSKQKLHDKAAPSSKWQIWKIMSDMFSQECIFAALKLMCVASIGFFFVILLVLALTLNNKILNPQISNGNLTSFLNILLVFADQSVNKTIDNCQENILLAELMLCKNIGLSVMPVGKCIVTKSFAFK